MKNWERIIVGAVVGASAYTGILLLFQEKSFFGILLMIMAVIIGYFGIKGN